MKKTKQPEQTEIIYIMQDLDWFKKNAYEDPDGDFWEMKEDFNEFETDNEITPKSKIVYKDIVNVLLTEEQFLRELLDSDLKWGLKIKITKDKNPEYWL